MIQCCVVMVEIWGLTMKINLQICDSGMSLKEFAVLRFADLKKMFACPSLPAKYRHCLHSHTYFLIFRFWIERTEYGNCREIYWGTDKRKRLAISLDRAPNSWSCLQIHGMHWALNSGGTVHHIDTLGMIMSCLIYTVRCDELKLTWENLFLCYLIGIFSRRSWK